MTDQTKTPEHVVRMESEMAEVDERITKAEDFLKSPAGQKILNRKQTHLLHIQLDVMRTYRRVLAIRIEYDTRIHENQDAQG